MTHSSDSSASDPTIQLWGRWAAVLGGFCSLLVLIALPPVLALPWRAVLMEGFSAVCHQLPARSPHVHGVALAVCHRCLGIYGGLAIGALVTPLIPRWAATVHSYARYALLGTLAPMGADWLADALDLWGNTPLSRTATGGLVGVIAGLLVAYQLARSRAPAPSADPHAESTTSDGH